MLEGNRLLGVAVSGGADSVALLHVMREVAPEFGVRLHVVHLNHQLRGPESEADERFVQEMAESLGLACTVERADPGAAEDNNLEQACREARLAFFARVRAEGKADRVATGHTLDDQAETLLFRLLRGSGPGGLAGILPVTREGLIRPMLGLRRVEIREWLAGRGIRWREDATNLDPRFARNRIRMGLMPQLEEEWNPALAVMLGQTAELSRQDEEYMAGESQRIMEEMVMRRGDGSLVFAVERLTELPAALRGRVVRRAIGELRGDLRGIEFRALERIEGLWESREGSGRLQIPGVDVMRSFDWLRLAKTETGTCLRNWTVEVAGAGRYECPGGEVVLEQGDTEGARGGPEPAYNEDTCWLDLDRWGFPLALRNWRPGDIYQRKGASRPERLKELFQSHRIPLWERRNWPMVAKGDEIVWSQRFGPAQAATPAEGEKPWRLRFYQNRPV